MLYQSIINFSSAQAKPGIKILSPASGQLSAIDVIPGAHHLLKSMGEGIAITLEGQDVYAPIKGKIIEWQPAFGKLIIQAPNKMRFLLQLSFQHAELHGLGISANIQLGQTVNAGDLLFQLDLYKIKLHYKPVTLYFILIDYQQIKSIDVPHKYVSANKDVIFSLVPKVKNKSKMKEN